MRGLCWWKRVHRELGIVDLDEGGGGEWRRDPKERKLWYRDSNRLHEPKTEMKRERNGSMRFRDSKCIANI